MFKKIATLITILGTLAFFTLFLLKYIPYRILVSSSPSHIGLSEFQLTQINNNTNKLQALNYLDQLTKIPIFGFLFDGQKIEELIRLQKYEECIIQSQKVLEKYFYQRSFIIWYYKAVAECRLFRKDACQGSLNKATLYSRRHIQKWRIQNLHNYIQKQFLQTDYQDTITEGNDQMRNDKKMELQEMKLKSLQEL